MACSAFVVGQEYFWDKVLETKTLKKALAGRKIMRIWGQIGEIETAAVRGQLLETRSLVEISNSC
jgi:hypothetical protein